MTDVSALFRARTLTSWCVARNYRAELMAPGDPVVFWISGSGRGSPAAGVWGIGRLTGTVVDGRKPSVPMVVRLLTEPVTRLELRAMPEFATLEVLRQPMGSNPSWLDKTQWQMLHRLLADIADEPSRTADIS